MKKFIKITLSCLLVVLSLTFTKLNVNAASVAIKPTSDQVKLDSTVDFIVSINQNNVTSGSIAVNASEGLLIESTEWLNENLETKEFVENNGTFTFLEKSNIDGDFLKITARANAVVSKATITINVQLKNGNTNILKQSTSASVQVVCAVHNFLEDRIEPTCESEGLIVRTCSTCKVEEGMTIAALGHSISNKTITQPVSCLENGIITGECDICHQLVTVIIPATGHSFGPWTTIEESTCQNHGTEERICSICGFKETREMELKWHALRNPITIQNSTLYHKGIISGTCMICGQKSFVETGCKESINNVVLSCKEGTFAIGSKLVVNEIAYGSDEYNRCANAIKHYSDKFVLYDIHVELNGYEVKPNDTVTLQFDIPNGFSSKLVLVHVNEQGELELVNCTIDDDTGTLTADVDLLSNYALVEVSQTVIEQVQVIQQNGLWPIIAISLGIVALGLLCVVIFIPKSHTKTKTKKTKTKSKKDNSNSFDFK